ncbi:MAG: Mrp/NBP35 family ATP-binding protein [Myxococcales bacterium]|nr:Mrp/NBP35 family ATP-binding protein [Myxococcales bacterium]
MNEPPIEALRAALEAVVDPTFERTLGSLGTLLELDREEDKIRIQVALSAPSERIQETIEARVRAALEAFAAPAFTIRWELRVPTRETASNDPIPSVRNVILVMSGKGGVGKSTVATNLALALRRAGSRVGLLDADIYGPSVPTMLGIQGHPTSKDGKRIEPLSRFGMKLMSIGFLLEDPRQAVVWRGPMLHGALQQFISDVSWGELDYLVLDLPPGTGDVALTLAEKLKITGAVMVTTPQEVALQDVYKAVSMCQKLGIPLLGIVENMSFFEDPSGQRHEIFGQGGGEKIAEFAKAPLLGQIPIDPLVRQWGDDGTPVVQAAPGSEVGKALRRVAENLAERIALQHFERAGGEKAPPTGGPKRLRVLS